MAIGHVNLQKAPHHVPSFQRMIAQEDCGIDDKQDWDCDSDGARSSTSDSDSDEARSWTSTIASDEQYLNEHHTVQEKIVYFDNLASSPVVVNELASSGPGRGGYGVGVGSISAGNARGAAMVRSECMYCWVEDEEDALNKEENREVVQDEEETALSDDEADAVNEEQQQKVKDDESGQYEVGNYFEWMPAEKLKAKVENDK